MIPLTAGWTLTPADPAQVPEAAGPIPTTVPGCVHTDLLAAGLIEDPYRDANEVRLAWIGRADWRYETTFEAKDAERLDLVCHGLDTVATLSLNGTELGRTANMHRSYRFDLRGPLRPGRNTLAVRFDSAYRYAEAIRDALGARPGAYPEPYQYIRKMACNFGWDWGPTLVTAGIWRPIGLHAWHTARIAEVRPLSTVDGKVEVHVTVERARDTPLTVVARIGGAHAEIPIDTKAVVRLQVRDPARWFPRGYGDQPRYDLDLTLQTGDGSTLDRWTKKIGFRSVRLNTAPDADGSPFTVVVNDVPVFVRGANWIPDDTFPSRMTRDRYEARLTQAADANVNYLRVWGGGIYESEDFYDLADELGLLVGQDFLFACAAYPEEEPLAAEVAAEAREQVTRLARHPSLVLWTGNNENIWGFHDWGWEKQLAGRTWGEGYYLDVLPRIVAELDPTRPYWPGSPYSGTGRHPNDPGHGTTHIWDVWNTHDYTHYRSYRPRFVAEFGYQAPPAYATLRAAVTDDPPTPDSPGVAHHQKALYGNEKLRRGLAGHLPVPEGFDDWLWATQLNQARAIRYGIEHFRALRPLCMGTIVWQLNDCWPVISWSAVDGAGRRKPLWYALRRAYEPRLLTIAPRDGGLVLVAVNDTVERWTERVDVTRCTRDGSVLGRDVAEVDVVPGAAVSVPLPLGEVIAAGSGPGRAWWFAAEGAPVPDFTAGLDGDRVTVTAGTLLRDVALFPDRLDPAAWVDDALVTLLPGESATFTVRSDKPLDPAKLLAPPVLRSAGDLYGMVRACEST